MRFNSLDYLFFFLAVVGPFFAIPARLRKTWLLVASLAFYMYWSPVFILLILYSTTIDYFVARRLALVEDARARRGLLAFSYVTNFGALFVFKYFDFFMDSWAGVMQAAGFPVDAPALRLILPAGISFYTFEAISYTTDVYYRKYPAERDYARLLLFIVYFPKLIAGPIERAWHLIPQFERTAVFEYARVREGLARILWGLFKKVVVADRLAVYVDTIYSHPDQHVGSTLLLATLFFTFQIYCDFSAYSDIASGTAQIMGIDLLRNFRRPYFASSIADFWSRWHISLSTWFRDYVYIPLGGNRNGFWKTNQNIFTVFLVSGIWHGANWTFVLWGIWHGVFLLAQNILERYAPLFVRPGRASHALSVAFTFVIVTLSWVLFRAASVSDALHVYRAIFTRFDAAHFFPGNGAQLAYGLFGIGVLLAVETCTELGLYSRFFLPRLKPARWLAYASMVLLLLLIGVVDGGQFIYFQF